MTQEEGKTHSMLYLFIKTVQFCCYNSNKIYNRKTVELSTEHHSECSIFNICF